MVQVRAFSGCASTPQVTCVGACCSRRGAEGIDLLQPHPRHGHGHICVGHMTRRDKERGKRDVIEVGGLCEEATAGVEGKTLARAATDEEERVQ